MSRSRSPSSRSKLSVPDDESLDRTLAVFQPRTKRRLTRQDAREIQRNLGGCMSILLEWHQRRQLATADAGGER